jgi:hypothetical protein
MKLYHYSEHKELKKLKVSYFGKHSYTNNDCNLSQVKRSFLYYSIERIEYRFKGKYCYTCDISNNYIYNLNNDVYKLKDRYKYNIDKMLRVIKKLGYKGVLYNIGSLHIVNLFYNVKVKRI